MKYFVADSISRVFIISLNPGDYILESINNLIEKENIKNAVVVSGIGTVDKCTIHIVTTTVYPPKEYYAKWENRPLEVASIMGVIAGGEPHLHITISDSEKAYAGHLEKGCRVLYLAEIVIVELKGVELLRAPDENNVYRLTKKAD